MNISRKLRKRFSDELWRALVILNPKFNIKTTLSFETLDMLEKDYEASKDAQEDFMYEDYEVLSVIPNKQYVFRVEGWIVTIEVELKTTYQAEVIICTKERT